GNGPGRAVEIARWAGMPLQIAAKVDPTDRPYFEREILPLLQNPLIEFAGEIAEADIGAFLGDAAALLFPIDWPEPFGLVQIEAMATGTPVIAFRGGSVPEIIEDGVTGFIVDDIESAVAAIPLAKALDRRVIRQEFERRFSDERMTRDYLAIYSVASARVRRDRSPRCGGPRCGSGGRLSSIRIRPCTGAPSVAFALPKPEDDSQFRIEATGSFREPRTRILKHGNTFAVLDSFGDMAGINGNPDG